MTPAFLRVCSGVFEKGMEVTILRSRPQDQATQPGSSWHRSAKVERAYPGDIIGIFGRGYFIWEIRWWTEPLVPLRGSDVSARALRTRRAARFARRKQVVWGSPAFRGSASFRQLDVGREELIIVVGALQFDVLCYRLHNTAWGRWKTCRIGACAGS